MPVQAEFNSRSGGNRIMQLAQTMCRVVRVSAPIVRARYSGRPALLALLDATEAVCDLLPAAQMEQAAADALDAAAFDPLDATVIPGQDAP